MLEDPWIRKNDPPDWSNYIHNYLDVFQRLKVSELNLDLHIGQ